MKGIGLTGSPWSRANRALVTARSSLAALVPSRNGGFVGFMTGSARVIADIARKKYREISDSEP